MTSSWVGSSQVKKMLISRHVALRMLLPCITVAVFRSVTALQLSVAHRGGTTVTWGHPLPAVVAQAAKAARRVL